MEIPELIKAMEILFWAYFFFVMCVIIMLKGIRNDLEGKEMAHIALSALFSFSSAAFFFMI